MAIRHEGNSEVMQWTQRNPYPLIVWGVGALLVFIAGFVLPFIYKNKTKLRQIQFDMWVYAVYLIRILVLMVLYDLMGKHFNYIHLMMMPENLFSFQLFGSIVLIAILIRFTQIRIKAAQPKEIEKKRTIVED
jgi:uncharacterized membrane protein